MVAYIRYFFRLLGWGILGVCACLVDVAAFGLIGFPYLQLLFSLYVTGLSTTAPSPVVFGLLILLAVQSFIFLGNGFMLIALAICIALLMFVLRQWLHLRILVPFAGLVTALGAQLVLWATRGFVAPSVIWVAGYFGLNLALLLVITAFCGTKHLRRF